MVYKTIVLEYAPKAKKMAVALEDKVNEMARQGWEPVSFTVTGSAKGILLLRSEEAREETCPDSVTEEEAEAAE